MDASGRRRFPSASDLLGGRRRLAGTVPNLPALFFPFSVRGIGLAGVGGAALRSAGGHIGLFVSAGVRRATFVAVRSDVAASDGASASGGAHGAARGALSQPPTVRSNV